MSTFLERIAKKKAELEELERMATEETERIAHRSDSDQTEEENRAQRKYCRGGRKVRRRENFGVSDSKLPWSQRSGQLIQPYENLGECDDPRLDRDENAIGKRNSTVPFVTGIDKFELRQPEDINSRPIDISLEKKDISAESLLKEGNIQDQPKGWKHETCETCSTRLAERYDRSNNEKDGDVRGRDSGKKEEPNDSSKSTERKPVSIRLDLNLELEILLRAKVKGDITITFL